MVKHGTPRAYKNLGIFLFVPRRDARALSVVDLRPVPFGIFRLLVSKTKPRDFIPQGIFAILQVEFV